MSLGSSPFKRGRDEEQTGNKRARTVFAAFGDSQLNQHVMPQQWPPAAPQPTSIATGSAYHTPQATYGMDMDMIDDNMLEDEEDEDEESPACGAALAARLAGDYRESHSNPAHPWNQNAPRMSHQLSTSSLSSGASSAAPGTPLDFPDQYCATFVDSNGQSRHFASSAPSTSSSLCVYPSIPAPSGMMDGSAAFANYAMQHGFNHPSQKTQIGSIHISQPGMTQLSSDRPRTLDIPSFGWDVPSQSSRNGTHFG
ncbi:BQ2448_6144 [Microbotryum intermedium]|uniref:BQ2448_6144 protein n=1 Tax=Microbotryum intermedium TaxID=269621 RepID=A0A238FP91_9BASI|nr:BQ2448_6144 [Microbotryum intermedium]